MTEFEWDQNNLKHISVDHPERENTIEEVESVFHDPDLVIKIGKLVNNEQRFYALGRGDSGLIRFVVYSTSNGKIRPISSWPANTQTRRFYENSKK